MRTYFIYSCKNYIPRIDERSDEAEILNQKLFYTSNP